MSDEYLDKVLTEIGWVDGFRLPIANAENKELEEEVARLSLERIKAKNAFENGARRLENLENHLKFVTQETEENQKVITAHAQQLETEEQNLALINIESKSINRTCQSLDKEIGEINERFTIKKCELEKCLSKLERLKSETSWDMEVLSVWERSNAKTDKDNELLAKFSREDEKKYAELETKRQNLQKDLLSRKEMIEKLMTNIDEHEKILERTGKIMKQQIVEKDHLIEQWKNSVRILRQRDKAIDGKELEMAEQQECLDRLQELLDEQNLFLKNEKKNNATIEQEIEELNAINSKLRRDMTDLENVIGNLETDMSTARSTLTSAANELEKKRLENRFKDKELDDKQKEIQRLSGVLSEMRAKEQELNLTLNNANDRMKLMDKMLENEEKQSKILQNEIETAQVFLYQSQKNLDEQINIGKTKDAELNSYVTGISYTKKQNKELQLEFESQNEIIYEMDFKIDEIQEKLLKAEYTESDENSEEIKENIKKLEGTLQEYTEVKTLLKTQVTRIQDDMRKLTAAISNAQAQLNGLRDKLEDNRVNFEGGRKIVLQRRQQHQERQVEENVLSLRVNYLEKTMKKHEKNICNLQKFRLRTEQMMSERMLIINSQKDVLQSKRRNLDEDKGRLRMDLGARRIRLEQFQKKYYLVLNTFGKDDAGQPLSVTHFKIKNAQEKYMLREEGDELDRKIRKAEEEIKAMENTLKLVNVTNSTFKNTLAAVEEKDQEMAELQQLEMRSLEVFDQLKTLKRTLNEKVDDLNDAHRLFDDVMGEKVELNEKISALETECNQLEKSIAEKKEKIERASCHLKKLQKKLKRAEMEKYDKNLEIREIQSANRAIIQKLADFCVRYQDMMEDIKKYTTELNIALPEKRLSLSSSSESRLSMSGSCKSSKSSSSSSDATVAKVVLALELNK